MAFEQKEMQGIIITDPKRACAMIIAALTASGVHIGNASAALGCNRITLIRWIAKLALVEQVDRMKVKAIKSGTYEGRKGGRPQGSTVASGAARRHSRTKASDRSDARS